MMRSVISASLPGGEPPRHEVDRRDPLGKTPPHRVRIGHIHEVGLGYVDGWDVDTPTSGT
ncbi:hypothetical protein GCM10011579_073380 [Streptomyces albiflavescens]|uniref:Uncharacterized protein n=1 Tax=Streptomyces albiflavescens TaxID=1623582 RepID=A0A917YAI3_9ACTN|nr:hypothetical protein GCM10011579_073380 [Streptomyces albiflavescens]